MVVRNVYCYKNYFTEMAQVFYGNSASLIILKDVITLKNTLIGLLCQFIENNARPVRNVTAIRRKERVNIEPSLC
jgi:hypothetical protein